MLRPGPGDTAPLQLSTRVDADFLDRAREELETLLRARLVAAHTRRTRAMQPWMRHEGAAAQSRPGRTAGARACAIGLSVLSLAGLFFIARAPADARFLVSREAAGALCAGALLLAWFPHGRWAAWVDRQMARGPRPRMMGVFARMQARSLLRRARAAAPFVGEYTLSGSQIVYARVDGERRTVVWERSLGGCRLPGEHFTLLFQTEAASAPYCLILHAPSPDFDARLETLGIRACVAASSIPR